MADKLVEAGRTEMGEESPVMQAFEQISRGIRALEGLPVEYGLARKLAVVQREIADHCAPKPVATVSNSCNRHVDCEMAVKVWLDKHPGKTRLDIPFSFHCHDEECEDCFGC